jgi:hypothetical protein
VSGHFFQTSSRAATAPIKGSVLLGETKIRSGITRSRSKPRKASSPPAEPFEHVYLLRKWSRVMFPPLEDHEVIGMVLDLVAQHENTKLIARTLLKNFRTFRRVVNASASAPMETEGMTEAGIAALKTVGQAAVHMLRGAPVCRVVAENEIDHGKTNRRNSIGRLPQSELPHPRSPEQHNSINCGWCNSTVRYQDYRNKVNSNN